MDNVQKKLLQLKTSVQQVNFIECYSAMFYIHQNAVSNATRRVGRVTADRVRQWINRIWNRK
jgi:hypothetical protein